MDEASAPARGDALERRAIWVLALAVLTLIFPYTYAGLGFGSGSEWWNVSLFVATQASLLLAVGAAALVPCAQIAFLPARVRTRSPAELLGWAVGFLWLGLFLAALNISIVAIDAIGTNEF